MSLDWIEPPQIFVPEDLQQAVGGHPLVAAALVRRGISAVEQACAFLDPQAYGPASAYELPDMEQATDRVESAIRRGEKICVWGDFDVDGQTATTLLVSALSDLGARLTYHIPVRARESHGINLPALEQILDGDPAIKLLLTCDTGVAAHAAVDYAQGRGVDVVVTDHHELPESLPAAQALVNPNRLPSGHALHSLPGVGVAYKLAEALYARSGRAGEEAAYLDLAALGIVADVAELAGDTRYLLQRGLSCLRSPRRLGLKVLMAIAELQPEWLSEEHIGFVLGPRLNALGRLGDANPIVELLTTEDEARARTLAYHLEGLNAQRQLLTSQVYQGALAQIERDPALMDGAALVLSHADWPAGVIGIVASRLVERFHKPVVLISAAQGALGRASARSVEGVDITAAIAAQADLLEGYGGHAMAAGFGIQAERIPEFRRRLSATVGALGAPLARNLAIDAYLPLSEITLELVADLERLAPFGRGNPPLALASRSLRLVSQRKIGRSEEHLLLAVEDEFGAGQRVIWWGGADELEAGNLPQGRFDLAYTARASTFRGQRDVQIEWLDFRIIEQESLSLQARRDLEVRDFRGQAHPWMMLQEMEEPLQVWAEGEALKALSGSGHHARQRLGLIPAEELVVWTAPPDHATWQQALKRANPQRLALFALPAETDALEAFLARLGGLVKYALNRRAGRVELPTLAAAMAQGHRTVRIGLEWLAAQGHLVIVEEADEDLLLARGPGLPAPNAEQALERLKAALEETRAYRAYFARANPEALLARD